MATIISCSIDVTKIDKTKLIEGKNSAKYYNFDVIVNDEPNQYGKDVSIAESQSKEQRQAKQKKVFIGSGKTVWKKEDNSATVANNQKRSLEEAKEFRVPDSYNSLPF